MTGSVKKVHNSGFFV